LRRPNSAFSAALVALGLSAPVVLAQQFGRAPVTTPDTNQAQASSSFDPMMASRGARHMLRTGLDYIDYKEYTRALRYLRSAEARQGELDGNEVKALKQGIEQAQRGLRETGSPSGIASRSRPRPVGAITTATPPADPVRPAPVRSFDAIQLTSATQVEPATPQAPAEPTPGPALDNPRAAMPAPAPAPEPAAPAGLPEPSPAPPLTEAPALTQVPAPAPVAEPAGSSLPELPPLPTGEPTGPAPTPAPLDARPLPTPAQPEPTAAPAPVEPKAAPVEPQAAPAPAPAPVKADAPPVLNLEPLPETPTEAKPETVAKPAELPAPALAEAKPAELPAPALAEAKPAELPAPAPAEAKPAELPAPAPAEAKPTGTDSSLLLPPLTDPVAPAEAKAPASAPTPDATPASAPAPDPAQLPAPIAAPAMPAAPAAEPIPEPSPTPAPAATPLPAAAELTPAPIPTPSEPEPVAAPALAPAPRESVRAEATPPPAPAADELPPLPGAARLATPSPLPAMTPEAREMPPLGARRQLSPETEARIAQIAQRQADESRTRTGQPSILPRTVNIMPTAPADDANGLDNLGTSNANTRFELTRAPSPTEAWPIRRIPVPEEFVAIQPRDWQPARKYWQAPAYCHMPLYFQDAALERYGHSVEQFFGPTGRHLTYPIDDPKQSKQRMQLVQPFWSIGLFAFQVGTWPYKLIVDPPWEAEYDLGYYRPGDRIPTDVYYLPFHGVGQVLPPIRGRNW
jgi:hypothetical protein